MDLLGLNTKPKNATQPGQQVDSEQLALRERRKKARKPLAIEGEEDTSDSGSMKESV